MIEAITKTLPLSMGIAISPMPILAVIIMLMTARAKTNGSAFLVGWIFGIMAVGLGVLFLPGLGASDKGPSLVSGYVRVGLGLLLFLLAFRQWRKRPKGDEPVPTPKFLAKLDGFGAPQSAFTGFLLSALNPKNFTLIAAGAATLKVVQQSFAGEIGALLVFTGIASTSIAIPILGYFTARTHAEILLSRWKIWLTRNNAMLRSLVVFGIGLLLFVRGLGVLLNA